MGVQYRKQSSALCVMWLCVAGSIYLYLHTSRRMFWADNDVISGGHVFIPAFVRRNTSSNQPHSATVDGDDDEVLRVGIFMTRCGRQYKWLQESYFEACPRCQYTPHLNQSDAVFFTIHSMNDYCTFDLPPRPNPRQKWVMVSRESARIRIKPRYYYHFNVTVSPMRYSDVVRPFGMLRRREPGDVSVNSKRRDVGRDLNSKRQDVGRDVNSKGQNVGRDLNNRRPDVGRDLNNKRQDVGRDVNSKRQDVGRDLNNKRQEVGRDLNNKRQDVGRDLNSKRQETEQWYTKNNVAWLVSNCEDDWGRRTYADALAKYIDVTIFGRCGTQSCPRGQACMRKLNRSYRFYLAFENSLCVDYITEKLYRTLDSDMIPIVYGLGNYTSILPPKAAIDVRDFASPKHLADYLKTLAANKTLFDSYFEWKKEWEVVGYEYYEYYQDAACLTCEYLHSTKNNAPHTVDLAEFTSTKHCVSKDVFLPTVGVPTGIV